MKYDRRYAMTKRMRIILVSVGAVILTLALVFGGMALAENNRNHGMNNTAPGWYGGMGRGATLGPQVINDAVTTLLGMTQADIQTQLRDGKSLVEIAATKNVTEEALTSAIINAAKTKLQEKVTSNDLTQKQVDAMLQQLQNQISKIINYKSTPAPFMGGRGMMGGHPAINDALTTLLGMSQTDISTQLRAGKSLVEIAATKNITEQALVDALVAAVKAKLDTAVANQDITQKVADSMLQREQDNISKMVNNKITTTDRMGPGGFGGHPFPGGRGFNGMGMMGKGCLGGRA